MKKLIFVLLVSVMFGCGRKKQHSIQVMNNSDKTFDSIVVHTRGATKVIFLNLAPATEGTKTYEVDKEDTAFGDNAFTGNFYTKDTIINRSGFAYHSSPGSVPEKVKLVIGKDLSIAELP
jgi:hypothetical protein